MSEFSFTSKGNVNIYVQNMSHQMQYHLMTASLHMAKQTI